MSDDWKCGTGRGRGWTTKEETILRDMRSSGKTTTEIAKHLGCKVQRVKDKLKQWRTEPLTVGEGHPRGCLCCGKQFLSAGSGNRLCGYCKETYA